MKLSLLLHGNTEQSINNLVSSTPHASLIVAPAGTGKKTIVRYIAQQILGSESLSSHAYYTEIKPDKSITIEQIRDLNKFMKLKTSGTASIRRVALVLEADNMTTEAQNALLKLLEEPPADTMLIMTAANIHNLLPTIQSRVQITQIVQPTKKQTFDFFNDKNLELSNVSRAYSLSGGRIGLMTALLDTAQEHPLKADITYAKELMQMSTFNRLVQIEKLAKDKQALEGFLTACKRIAQSAIQTAAEAEHETQVIAWHSRLKYIVASEKALQRNASPKILLSDLFLSL